MIHVKPCTSNEGSEALMSGSREPDTGQEVLVGQVDQTLGRSPIGSGRPDNWQEVQLGQGLGFRVRTTRQLAGRPAGSGRLDSRQEVLVG